MEQHILYSDGNLLLEENLSGYGGYILNNEGKNLVEYTGRNTTAEHMNFFELIGITEGLKIALSMGIKNIVVRSDSLGEVNTLNKNLRLKNSGKEYSLTCSPIKANLFEKALAVCNDFDNIVFEWIPRQENRHADFLSKIYLIPEKKDFPIQFRKTLDVTESYFEKGEQPDFHFLFSHPKLEPSIHKNNPYIPSEVRTKKISKMKKAILRTKNNFQYVFIETLKTKNEEGGYNLHFKAFGVESKGEYLDENANFQIMLEHVAKINSHSKETEMYAVTNFMIKVLKSIDLKHVWIDSNHRYLEQIFQQNSPIHKKYYKKLSHLYNQLNAFDKVVFHTFHFTYKYSNLLQATMEAKKKKIKNKIESIEDLQKMLAAEKHNPIAYRKSFSALIQCNIREYKKSLTREMTQLEKEEIIAYTKREMNNINNKHEDFLKKYKI